MEEYKSQLPEDEIKQKREISQINIEEYRAQLSEEEIKQ